MERDSFEYQATEHLRMNGMYWALTALDLFIKTEEEETIFKMDKDKVIDFVLQCQHENGGFSGNVGHDPHLLYTLSAVQVLALYRALDRIDKSKIANYVASLQKPDGSFMGDEWGEVDTRFSYCALNCLRLLGCSLEHTLPYYNNTVEFILSCRNFDGGFGAIPGAESHAGQIFCCVGALAILNALDKIDQDTLSWWLCERQVEENGGLNGRPEKLSDVCYSWWVLSSLAMMDRVHWIHKGKLRDFILNCQDLENGGISDKPNNMADIFHTFFGIAGLSLLREPLQLKTIDPMYALPVDTLRYCNIETPTTKRFLC